MIQQLRAFATIMRDGFGISSSTSQLSRPVATLAPEDHWYLLASSLAKKISPGFKERPCLKGKDGV